MYNLRKVDGIIEIVMIREWLIDYESASLKEGKITRNRWYFIRKSIQIKIE